MDVELVSAVTTAFLRFAGTFAIVAFPALIWLTHESTAGLEVVPDPLVGAYVFALEAMTVVLPVTGS